MSETTAVNTTVDHLFRHEYAKLVSYLISKFGTSNIDVVEDAVQESLYKAMQLWGYKGVPEEPSKWLYRVAHNTVVDNLRRNNKSVEFSVDFENTLMTEQNTFNTNAIEDEQLKMIFACCHPSMKESEQLILSLKLLCGFSNNEIARALFKESEAVKKAITRAKQKFKTEVGELKIPENANLNKRLSRVLKVIYLLFNNGYTAYDGDTLLKKGVCEDAIRLGGMLYQNEQCNIPELRALLALMCFNFSRFDARTDAQGNMLTLEQQDWNLWDKQLITLGSNLISDSVDGATVSNYHLEAGIAREYALAKDFDSIDWNSILTTYNVLNILYPSPGVELNRLVVLAKVEGIKKALQQLIKLDEKQYSKNHLYYAIKADFEKQLNKSSYKKSLEKAISLTNNQKEKEFLEAKI